jgi:formamidopyrimidine-DNA glycosylase
VPELPEVETIARDLQRSVVGAKIVGVKTPKPDVLRDVTRRTLPRAVVGATILRAWRRAKLVILDLDNGIRIAVQPRFTGAMLVDSGSVSDRDRHYATVLFELEDGRTLIYTDVRRLGTVAVMAPDRFETYTRPLGVEPLDPAFAAEHLSGILRSSRQAVKKVIMDQRKIAGVGNIYAAESLWRAKIAPSREARSIKPREAKALHEAIVEVLRDAITARGTSFRDYRDANGGRGGFTVRLDVYGRQGKACRRCRTTLVKTHEIDGRGTVFCPKCQR